VAPPRAGSNSIRGSPACPRWLLTIRSISSFLIMSTMCGRPSRTLLTRRHSMPASQQRRGRTGGGDQIETMLDRRRASGTAPALSRSRTLIRQQPERGRTTPEADCDLGVGLAEGAPGAHDLAGGFHFGTKDRIGLGELQEREHGFLDRIILWYALGSTPRSRSLPPVMTRAAILAIGTPVAFDTKGTVREARGLTSST